ncbi:FtsX-like permease family protein [Actinoplanes sp. HUAS TT8]|uniref:FtsX-like permease family protein n=1 Tax=Actinoplanes sp. HUAS TT8 TaxID=3447453 RepID=UPI003F528B1F
MFTILWGAVRSRAVQAGTLLVLTALPAAVAAAAPWFVLTETARTAAVTAGSTPQAQRTVVIHWDSETGDAPAEALAAFGEAVRRTLPMPGADGVTGLSRPMSVTDRTGVPDHINVDYRDRFCRHVSFSSGACPAAPGDAAITETVADRLGVRTGDTLDVQATTAAPKIPMRVTGIYAITDPAAGYWADELFRVGSGLDPIYTVAATFTGAPLDQPVFAWSAEVPVPLLRGDGGYDLGAAIAAAGELGDIVDPTRSLRADLSGAGDRLLRAVLLGSIPALLLGWYAIALAGRYTARDRRRDAALLKLRGGERSRLITLLSGQHLAPLLAGGLLGAAAGLAAARVLSGPGTLTAAALSVAAAAGVAVVALFTLVVGDLLLIRTPVVVLQREVPATRSGRAALLADVVLVAIAGAAAYQARSGSPDAGVGALAAIAVAVAVAVLVARLLIRAADRGGGAALRTGHLRVGLTAVRMSRLAGLDRVFALLAIAVALLVTTSGATAADRSAHTVRAESELGAARVLTVSAENWTVLQHAVATADPQGRYAMAAAVDRQANPPVLAVDTARLAAVGAWRPEYGPRPRPPARSDPVPPVTGRQLVLTARNDRGVRADIDLVLLNENTGGRVQVAFDLGPSGEQTVTVPVAGCDGGCRLVRWQIPAQLGPDGKPIPKPIVLRSLTQRGPDAALLGTDRLTDTTRWRTVAGDGGLELSAGPRGLAVGPPRGASRSESDRLYAVDTALPLPLLLAGPAPIPWRFGEPGLTVTGAGPVPSRVTATVPALPVLGAAGLLTDFDALRRLAGEADPTGVTQVWLTADAPGPVVDRLRAAGLTVLADETAADRAARTPGRGTAPAGTFTVFCAVIALLTAAAATAVAASVDRAPQRAAATALRVQGLPARTLAGTRYLGPFALVGAAVLGGVLAASVARRVAGEPDSFFADGWRLLPPPEVLGWGPLLISGLAAMLCLSALAGLIAVSDRTSRDGGTSRTGRAGRAGRADRAGDR